MSLVVDGERRVMRLTLGALAALEAELQTESLLALVERFETGQFAARDVLALVRAGLAGGGAPDAAAGLASAEIEGGPIVAARAAAELLARAFQVPE